MQPQFLDVGAGAAARRIAVRARSGATPAVVWLGGFMSDMASTKALALDQWGERNGRAIVRFDYSGHGESGGAFTDGTIGRWLEESLAVIERFAGAAPVLLGSSMGGWLSLLAARALATRGSVSRPSGLVLIAPAVDMTEALMWANFPPEVKRAIETGGVWHRPSAYGPAPYPITRGLIEEGRRHLLLDGPLALGCPVHIVQGMLDPDVPWTHAQRLAEHLPSDPVTLTFVKDGEHRLSREEDIGLILRAVEGIGRAA